MLRKNNTPPDVDGALRHSALRSCAQNTDSAPRLQAADVSHGRPTIGAALDICLTSGSYFGWLDFAKLLRAKVSEESLAHLSVIFLHACSGDNRSVVLRNFKAPSPLPIAALYSEMEEANLWADMATVDELKAALVASYDHLPAREQKAFRQFLDSERRAA